MAKGKKAKEKREQFETIWSLSQQWRCSHHQRRLNTCWCYFYCCCFFCNRFYWCCPCYCYCSFSCHCCRAAVLEHNFGYLASSLLLHLGFPTSHRTLHALTNKHKEMHRNAVCNRKKKQEEKDRSRWRVRGRCTLKSWQQRMRWLLMTPPPCVDHIFFPKKVTSGHQNETLYHILM